MLDKALRASNLLSLVDGSRKQPDVTNLMIQDILQNRLLQQSMQKDQSCIQSQPRMTVTNSMRTQLLRSHSCCLWSIETCAICWARPSRTKIQLSCIEWSKSTSKVEKSPCRSSRKKAECSPIWIGYRMGHVNSFGADLGSRDSSKDEDARVAEIWYSANNNALGTLCHAPQWEGGQCSHLRQRE